MKNSQGFTLIEVLITMVVLAVGLLGLAALQITSLKHNQTAYFRSQATQLAYDMADRMRANPANAQTLADSNYVTGTATANVGCSTVDGCTPSEMAKHDLFEWNSLLVEALPGDNALGTITYANPFFKIVIQWDDNRDGVVDASDASFQTDFQL